MLFSEQSPFEIGWEMAKAIFQFSMTFWQLWVIVFALLVLSLLIEYFSAKREVPLGYQYRSKDSIMTGPERDFFKVLIEIVDNKYYVFPQVHLDAFLNYKIPGQNWFGAFRHIDEKSVDFLICDKINEKPLLVIELDDRSHEQPNRIERDREVERIFLGANLSIQRFSQDEARNKELVRRRLVNLIKIT